MKRDQPSLAFYIEAVGLALAMGATAIGALWSMFGV